MRQRAPKAWDRHAIMAEVRRRGGSLSKIARDAGFHPTVCRHAVGTALRSPTGEKLIADFLGVSAAELWPARYDPSDREPTTNVAGGEVENAMTFRHPSAPVERVS
jgi:Ner family transcriptional regulator